MTNVTAYISAEDIQSSEDWYAWFFDRSSGYLQVDQEWYSWNFERAPVQTELVFEQGTIVLSADTLYSITGIELASETGTVIARGTSETQIVPSKVSYKKPKKNASISIIGLDLSVELGEPLASGTIIINNVVKIRGVEVRSEASAVNAEGVLNLTDDEIILLMAA
jgi:actin-related protein